MLFQDVAFWVIAVVAVAASVGVVVVRDLFRAALLLALVFVAVAGFFVLMSAEFLAVVQVLIYVGAISVLFIFAVMLTQDVRRGNLPNRLQVPAVVLPVLLFAAMAFTILATDWPRIPPSQQGLADLVQTQSVSIVGPETLKQAGVSGAAQQQAVQTAGLADLLLGDFVLPFEMVSVLLLAALIGALALARGRQGA